jgi:hypothetical protein
MDINTLFYNANETGLVRTPADALQSVLNTDILSGVVNGWYDTGSYNTMYLTLLGGATITAGAVTIEQTNDPLQATGRPNMYRDAETVGSAPLVSAITVSSGFYKQYFVPITSRYIRIRVSTAFTGAATGVRAVAVLDKETVLSDVMNGVSLNGTVSASIASSTAPTVHTLNSAASTNATSVKAAAGTLMTIAVSNQNAAARFLKLYNKASAPTVGTDIPVMVIPLPASSYQTVDFDTFGSRFSAGIAYAITGLIADTDATAVTAGDTKVVMNYI